MKKYYLLLLLLLIPFKVNAVSVENYNTTNFMDTLKAAGIQTTNKNYTESKDAVPVYLFWGNGCHVCHDLLSFFDENLSENGKYYKLVAFEVFGNSENKELMYDLADFTGKQAMGVPYIVIGDKVFNGFSREYSGNDIKETIVSLYKTEASKRYDIMQEFDNEKVVKEEIKEAPKNGGEKAATFDETFNTSESSSSTNILNSNLLLHVANAVVVGIATITILLYNRYRFNKLEEKLVTKKK